MTLTDTPTTAASPAAVTHTAPSGARHWTGAPADSRWTAAARELVPSLALHAATHDREGSYVTEGCGMLRQRRFMSLMVPAELGGGGATFAEAGAVLAELAHGCPATSLTYSMHSHLVAAQMWRHHRGLPAPVLEKVAAGQLWLVSTGASDWIDSSGTATPVDGGFRVSGRKSPASGCPSGDIAVTSFRWETAPDGPQVIHCAVPFTADGVSIDETWNTLGMRGTGSHTVVFDDVFVPEASVALVRPAGQWHPVWSTVLGVALPLIMATYVGVAESAAERAIELVAHRGEQLDTSALVGRMLNRLTAARDAVAAMIAACDEFGFDNVLAHSAATLARKTTAVEAAIDTVRIAIEVAGGAGFALDGGLERLYRDVHAALYHPLPAARQERFSGRVALGLDPLG